MLAVKQFGSRLRQYWRLLLLLLLPLLLLPLLTAAGESYQQKRCAALLIIVAVLWVFELLPLSLTALLPFVLAPLLGIGQTKLLAKAYFTELHFLLIGGVVLAAAMEVTGLSRRLALRMVLLFGSQPRWLLLGFMLPSWLLSMWMSNTGTTVLMFPFVSAAVEEIKSADAEEDIAVEEVDIHDQVLQPRHKHRMDRLAVCFCLSVAYASNVGGVATLIGTGTNLVFAMQVSQLYSVTGVVNFANWMLFSFPLSLISLLLLWLLLQLTLLGIRETFRRRDVSHSAKRQEAKVHLYFKQQLAKLGPTRFGEWVTLLAFPLTLVLLLAGDLSPRFGWHHFFPTGDARGSSRVGDSTGMMLMAVLLLLMPRGGDGDENDDSDDNGKRNNLGYRPILTWRQALDRIPFDILLLIGGGLAMAQLTRQTGLSRSVGQAMLPLLRPLPTPLIVLLICFGVVWITEVTSNMATVSVLLPIVAQLSNCLQINPLMLMLPLTVTCTFAFCLPTATPPNAIVFAHPQVKLRSMMKAGVWLNIIFAFVITAYTLSVGKLVFNIDQVPDWVLPEHLAACGGNSSEGKVVAVAGGGVSSL